MIELNKLYQYEQLYGSLYELGRRYQAFSEFRLIGMSHDERKIPMLQIGSASSVLLCTAGIHGRERVNPVLLVKMAEEYCQAYERGWTLQEVYPVRRLLDQISICLIPLVNPDGYEIASRGFRAIRNPVYRQMLKMKQLPAELWKENARGIDINRNFPCLSYRRRWAQDEPGSENETKALMHVMQETESVGYLDFHSRGKTIFYYRNAMPCRYNQRSLHLARELQRLSRYRLARRQEEMQTIQDGGNSVQYYAESRKNPSLTIETLEENAAFPLSPSLQQEAYQEIHMLPLEYLFHLLC